MENTDINTEVMTEKPEYISDTPELTEPIDPFDPFDNPTENHSYNSDYSDVVPQLCEYGCEIPHKPSKNERKKIRRFYNIGGGGILINLFLSFAAANIISIIVTLIMITMIDTRMIDTSLSGLESKGSLISDYISNSAISPAITLLSYLISNLGAFFIGMKLLGQPAKSALKNTAIPLTPILSYVLIGLFIQRGTGMLTGVIEKLFSNADIIGNAKELIHFSSQKALFISVLYSCIAAPITEELFYRGFLLKAFSKVSQRFGIVMSAAFFGLAHGNVAQFILAFTLGLFLGYIDIKHDSVIPSILVHFFVNAVGTISTVILYYFPDNTSEITGIATVIMMSLALIGAVLFVIFLKNNIFPKKNIHQQYRCGSIAITSVTTVAAALFYLIITVKTTFF